ncbi:response regulator [Chthonobacter albigriseus]|uniref:response regulator n=1 Tax=Chthonobacter albigriseus TaxID=1683161 RepID=UPI0015EF8504|nr:response regulator [Chthonobacter albigriseus]
MRAANILIVEDDAIFALDLQDIVWEAGGTPIGPARCMQGALELCHRYPIDLAIIDVNLQDGPSGLALARMLGEQHGIRTVIVSGNVPAAEVVGDTEHVFVQKPVPSEVLARLVKPVVDSLSRQVA